MARNFFEDYDLYINNLKNRIMQLHLKFVSCRNILERDYENGLISEEEYNRYKNLRMDESFTGAKKDYVLSAGEIKFLKEYASFDAKGELYLDLVKPVLIDKQRKLGIIFESVRTFDFFESLSFEDRKRAFLEVVNNDYAACVEEFNAKIESIRQRCGERYVNTSEYKELIIEMNAKATKRITTKDIEDTTEDKLTELIERYYSIDYGYYRWYRDMELKEEYDNGFIYAEQIGTLGKMVDSVALLVKAQDDSMDLNTRLENCTNQLNGFLALSCEFKYDEVKTPTKKERGLFGRVKPMVVGNKEELEKTFSMLLNDGGILEFAASLKDKDDVSLSDMFDKYFRMVYGGAIDFVDVNVFVQRMIREVVKFYREKINEVSRMLSDKLSVSKKVNDSVYSDVVHAKHQALVCMNIYERIETIRTLACLDNFTLLETQKIFQSLRDYLLSEEYGTKTLEEERVSKKV